MRDSADWLFKCIVEAYGVLADPAARQDLDVDLARQDRRGSTPATRSSPARHYSTYRCTALRARQRWRWPAVWVAKACNRVKSCSSLCEGMGQGVC